MNKREANRMGLARGDDARIGRDPHTKCKDQLAAKDAEIARLEESLRAEAQEVYLLGLSLRQAVEMLDANKTREEVADFIEDCLADTRGKEK